MAYDTNNIFAKILRNEVDCTKVLENEHILALFQMGSIMKASKVL